MNALIPVVTLVGLQLPIIVVGAVSAAVRSGWDLPGLPWWLDIPYRDDLCSTEVHIIARRTLREYWEREPRAEQPLKAWYAIVTNADWSSPVDVKRAYGNASIVGNDRVVFNIGGNRYRLIVRFDYARRVGFVRFVGTHVEYDAVDASKV